MSVAQYPNEDTCMLACHAIGERAESAGFAETDSANTVFCRQLRAEQVAQAAGDKADFCSKAGPGGKGIESDACTDTKELPYCEGYCTLYVNACKGKSSNPFKARPDIGIPGTDNVANLSDCIKACASVPPIPSPGNYAFADGESGNTMACRLRWATAATLNPSEANCIRAGIRPQDNCQSSKPSCNEFCRASRVACPGSFDDLDHCLDTCNAIPTGNGVEEDIVGPNTLYCRNTHVFVALLVNEDHCMHAGVLGSNVCGGNCDAYCSLTRTACSAEFEKRFGDAEEADQKCKEECEGLEGVESDNPADYTVEGGSTGNSVQCRALHASRALSKTASDADKAANCDAAFGGEPCH